MSNYLRIFATYSVLLFFFLQADLLRAEVVYMKSGQIIIGRITSQTKDTVTIATQEGMLDLSKDLIQRISFNKMDETDLMNKKEENEKLKEQEEKSKVILAEMAADTKERYSGYERNDKQRKIRREEEENFFSDELGYLRKKKKEKVIVRSNFIPGWGQFMRGDVVRGSVIAGLFTGSIVGSYYTESLYTKEKQEYNNNNMSYILMFHQYHSMPLFMAIYYQKAQDNKKGMESSAGIALSLSLIAAGIYLANQLDARLIDPEVKISMINENPSSRTAYLHYFSDSQASNQNCDSSYVEYAALLKNSATVRDFQMERPLFSMNAVIPIEAW